MTCHRAEKDDTSYKYVRVGPLTEETRLSDIQDGFRPLDGGECVDLAWIPPRLLSRTTTGK